MFPKAFKDLIDHLKKLPGVGNKTAERLALHIFNNFKEEDLNNFSSSLKDLKNINLCSECNILSDEAICKNCLSCQEKDKILIVENSLDAFQISKTNSFYGYFHIINCLIDYTKGIDETYLMLDNLLTRIKNNKISEIIIALNSTIQGEFTTQYLVNIIEDTNKNIKITKLAPGLPFGAELKYINSETLKRALENRIKSNQKKS